MLSESMSETINAAGRSGLFSDAVNIGSNLFIALILWRFATQIAAFVLKSFGKLNES